MKPIKGYHLPIPNGSQVDGLTRFVRIRASRRNSRHLNTFPALHSFNRQYLDISSICAVLSTWSHTLTFNNVPWNDWAESKPPPTDPCSCPNTKEPPCLIWCPVLKPLPSSSKWPSLWIFHDPELLSHDTQIWCHTPSLAITDVFLWGKQSKQTRG